MANQQHHHNITNGGGVHDGVFLCFDCNNRPFRSHMDLLRHRLNDPPPAFGEPVAAVPPQGLPQNGPVVDGHAVNEPPPVQPPVENGHAANDRVGNGAHD